MPGYPIRAGELDQVLGAGGANRLGEDEEPRGEDAVGDEGELKDAGIAEDATAQELPDKLSEKECFVIFQL
jgi:hypothetical protein